MNIQKQDFRNIFFKWVRLPIKFFLKVQLMPVSITHPGACTDWLLKSRVLCQVFQDVYIDIWAVEWCVNLVDNDSDGRCAAEWGCTQVSGHH